MDARRRSILDTARLSFLCGAAGWETRAACADQVHDFTSSLQELEGRCHNAISLDAWIEATTTTPRLPPRDLSNQQGKHGIAH